MMRRLVIVAAAMAALSGCSAFPPYAVLDGATVVGTKKTMSDHVISAWSNKNCSTVRVEKGMTFCEEDEVNPEPEVFCYQTLGSVTCYDRPDPYRNRSEMVGRNDQNLGHLQNRRK